MNQSTKRQTWHRHKASLGLAALLAPGLSFSSFAGVFNNNFNSDVSGIVEFGGVARWVESGGVGGSGYVSLTDALNDQPNSTMIVNDLDAGAARSGFLTTFKLRMGGGSGNAADGFAFSWGNDIASTFGEEGSGTGLSVCWDIYDNGGGEAPAIDIKVGGVVVRTTVIPKADILTGNDFVDVRIELRNGLLNVDFKGQPFYQSIPIVLAPIEGGRFGFGARTGGENNNHWIDDLSIETFAQTTPAVANLQATANGFAIALRDAPGAAVNVASVTATFNGTATGSTATKSGDLTSLAYAGPTLLAPGSDHTVVVSYTYGAGNTPVSLTLPITTPDYTVVPASLALPAGAVNTAQRGFTWSIHQVDDGGTALATSKSRTINQLAGLLGNNIADPDAVGGASGAASAPSPATAPIHFRVTEVINFNQFEGSSFGNFVPDLGMPGIPGTLGGTDSAAVSITTAIEFPAAGTYSMVVNSDDGFETSVGANGSDLFAIRLGGFEGGRGAADTMFHFFIEAPGFYSFRTLYYEGGGDANIEWSSVLSDGSRALINDTASNANALKAYLPPTSLPAYVQRTIPLPGAVSLLQINSVEAFLVDAGTTVNTTGITLRLNGSDVPVTATKTAGVTRVLYNGGLNSSTDYTVELTYSDNVGPRTVSWTFNSGLVNTPIFVIEAEDFDYDGGQSNPQQGVTGMDVNVMPYLGGAYQDLSATIRVDFNNNDGPDSDQYRQEVGDDGLHKVNISARNNNAPGNGLGGHPGINASDRLTYTTTVNYGIGWVGGGDWQNYTRTFPANNSGGWWKVFAGLSYGGTGDGQLAGSLDQVTAGVGTETQTLSRLGQFSGPGSGGWGNNNLVPMRTASGDVAAVKLTGKQTVRFNLNSGDFDFLIFSPTPAPPPFIESVPQDSGTRTNVVLDWVLRDTDAQVNPASVRVHFNNVDVTAQTTTTKTATGATVQLNLAGTTFAAGEYPWRLSFADNSAPPQPVEGSGIYVVVPYPAEPNTIFVIEAEDFNYSDDNVTGGKTNPQQGTEGLDVNVMPYLGGAYEGLAAVKGVDYNNADGNDSDLYRTELDENGENEINIGASNGTRYGNDRGWFTTTTNYRIGWVAPGEWQNYTRTFPQGTYNVWAAMSYDGRAAGQLTGSLDLVTSNPAQPNQTVERVGNFTAPGSGGWGRNELVPMKNEAGQILTVPMGGVQTVRFNLGSGDIDYLLFVNATAPVDRPEFTSVVRNANGSITVSWTGGGTLQAAPAVNGPWADVPGATSPYTLQPTADMLFGRIRQ